MPTLGLYAAAALAEIGGCFAVWAWWRGGHGALWRAPAAVSLALFAWLLALVPVDHAGRAYAVYGGIYIAASLIWLWLGEGQRPDRWDLGGGLVVLLGAALIMRGPRNGA